ncbi:MAG: hypothetical protein B7Z55_11095, partial [Planctomycetales bacterium 12-60-4]
SQPQTTQWAGMSARIVFDSMARNQPQCLQASDSVTVATSAESLFKQRGQSKLTSTVQVSMIGR